MASVPAAVEAHHDGDIQVEEGDFFFAAAGVGALPRIGGGRVRISAEDVAFYDASEQAFDLFFNGSDAGLRGAMIDAFAFTHFPHAFALSFVHPVDVPGVGPVDDSDVVEFAGEDGGTPGFRLLFDGSDVGLTEDSEDIDALEVTGHGAVLHLSTTGPFSAASGAAEVQGSNEDVFRCNGQHGADTDCEFNLSLNIDGSQMGMTESGEGVDAFAGRVVGPGPDLEWTFSTHGAFAVNGASGRANDAFACRGARSCGPPGTFGLVFRGSDHHTGGNITAIDFDTDL